MLRIETLIGHGRLLAPVPVEFDVVAAERFIRDRFQHERVVLRSRWSPTESEAVGTGKIDFDLTLEGIHENQWYQPAPSYLVGLKPTDIEIPARSLLHLAQLAAEIRQFEFRIASAAGGESIFQAKTAIVVGVTVL